VSEDGHIVRAASVFAVGDADAAARPSGLSALDPVTLGTGLTRALGDLGILVAAGAAAAWWLLGARAAAVARLRRLALAVALVGTLGWIAIELWQGGQGWIGTTFALAAIARVLLLVLALTLDGRDRRVADAAIVAALVTLALGGHTTDRPLEALLQSAHLLAAIVWLGAAPAVLLVMRDPAVTDTDALDVVRRFSRLAGFALVVLGGAGVLLGWLLTDQLAGGLTTYVLILAGKAALVAGAAVLGSFGRRALGRSPDRRQLGRLFAVDAGLLAAVAVLSSMLTLVSPHEGHAGHGGGVPPARCSLTVGTSSLAVVTMPGRVGSNELLVSGVPHDVQGVRVELVHPVTGGAPLTVELTMHDHGWVGTAAMPFEGAWDVTVVVRVDTFTEERGACELGIAP
jgi:putative copper export protein